MTTNVVLRVVPPAYAMVFLAAVLSKVDGWTNWTEAVRALYSRREARRVVAVAVPIAEAIAVVALLTKPRAGLAAAGVLLLTLAAGVAFLALKHRGVRCNCFGALANSTVGPFLAVRNAVLGSVALTLVFYVSGGDGLTQAAGNFMIVLGVLVLLGLTIELRRLHRVGVQLRESQVR